MTAIFHTYSIFMSRWRAESAVCVLLSAICKTTTKTQFSELSVPPDLGTRPTFWDCCWYSGRFRAVVGGGDSGWNLVGQEVGPELQNTHKYVRRCVCNDEQCAVMCGSDHKCFKGCFCMEFAKKGRKCFMHCGGMKLFGVSETSGRCDLWILPNELYESISIKFVEDHESF